MHFSDRFQHHSIVPYTYIQSITSKEEFIISIQQAITAINNECKKYLATKALHTFFDKKEWQKLFSQCYLALIKLIKHYEKHCEPVFHALSHDIRDSLFWKEFGDSLSKTFDHRYPMYSINIMYANANTDIIAHKALNFDHTNIHEINHPFSLRSQQCKYLEFDVCVTIDNVPVIHHDIIDVDGNCIETTESSQINHKIITLEEMLQKFIKMCDKSISYKFVMDLKGTRINPSIIRCIMEVLDEMYIHRDDVIIISFNRHYLEQIASDYKDVLRGYITANIAPTETRKFLEMTQCDYVVLDENSVNRDIVMYFRNHGYKVFVYTVNKKSYFKYIVSCDVDGIITDYSNIFKGV